MKTFVLCQQYPQMGDAIVFVCGPSPQMPTFDPTPGPAVRFGSPEDAQAFRALMPWQLGGGPKQYRVHELLPDGSVIDVEP